MTDIRPYAIQHYFTGGTLDRASAQRVRADGVNQLLEKKAARFLPLWRGQHLFSGGDARVGESLLAKCALTQLGLSLVDLSDHYWVFLGNDGIGPVFGLDISSIADAPARVAGAGLIFAEFKPFEFHLTEGDAALAAQLRGMVNWRAAHQFCGLCGQRTAADQAGHHLVCSKGHEHFPRTDPVAVILVHHQDRVLLAKGTRFPNKRLMSALSGFVEPGESIEETAVRETLEEVGIRAVSVSYHSSQPWPFPGIVMMGFMLEAESMDITLDPDEIAEARWFTRENIINHKSLGFEPPHPRTLAGQLLISWMSDA